MSYSETINYDSGGAFTFNTAFVEVASSTLRLKDLGGGTYTLLQQQVTSQRTLALSALTSFSETSTLPANTSINYQIVLGGLNYYWNSVTAKWAPAGSDTTKVSSASVINAHASTLFSDLAILVPQFLALNVFLLTTNASNRPVLTGNAIGYSWAEQTSPVPNQCVVSGYLLDLMGSIPSYNASQLVQLLVSCDRPFFHGNNFIEPFTKKFSFDSSGHVSASLIETATPGVKLKFAISFYDGSSIWNTNLFSAIVPNQSAININNLTAVYPASFG